MIKHWLCTFAVTGALLGTAAPADYTLVPANQVETDTVLAEVNGKAVTLSDVMFETWREETKSYALFSGAELEDGIATLRRQALEDLIDRQLVIDDFAASGMTLDLQYIERLLDQIAREMGCSDRVELKKRAREFNISMTDLRQKAEDRLKAEMMFARLFYTKINLTPRELHEYIQQNIDSYVDPAKIRLRLLKLNAARPDLEERTEEIQRALASGEKVDFDGMVRLWSDGPAKNSGGDLGWLEEKRVRQEFASAIGAEPTPGAVFGPVRIDGEGVYFIQVTERSAQIVPDRAELAKTLRTRLENEQREKLINEYLLKLRAQSQIRYRD